MVGPASIEGVTAEPDSLPGKLTENQHLNPDYEVDNDPSLEASGRDQQFEKAVEVMLRKLDGK